MLAYCTIHWAHWWGRAGWIKLAQAPRGRFANAPPAQHRWLYGPGLARAGEVLCISCVSIAFTLGLEFVPGLGRPRNLTGPCEPPDLPARHPHKEILDVLVELRAIPVGEGLFGKLGSVLGEVPAVGLGLIVRVTVRWGRG